MCEIRIPQKAETFKKFEKIIANQDPGRFNKRDIGLRLQTFLTAFTIVVCSMKNITLEGIAVQCQKLQYGLTLTKQALEKRLEAGQKELMTLLGVVTMTAVAPALVNPKVAPIIEQFSAVNVTDATTISLPDKLFKKHKGLGGTNAKSAMKLQTTYDVKSKTYKKIAHIKNATENDATYMDELIKLINPGDLSIADLGYYGVIHFKRIVEKGAYFMSKIKSNTTLYTEDGQQINLVSMLRGRYYLDTTVVIKGEGGKLSMPVRLCGVRLSDKSYNQRLYKANKKAKSAGKTLSKEEKLRLKWILIISNVSAEMMNYHAVCEVYRIRWQIELVFKSWKSHFAIDEMHNIGKHYLDCLLYGKLVVITVLTALHSYFHFHMLQIADRGVSFLRFMNNMRENLDIFLGCITHSLPNCVIIIAIERIVSASLLEKRKRLTTEQCIYELDIPRDVSARCSESHVSTLGIVA